MKKVRYFLAMVDRVEATLLESLERLTRALLIHEIPGFREQSWYRINS